MKILFLSPPMGMWVFFGYMKSIYPGYAQLAAYILEQAPEIEVEALDCPAMDFSHDKMLEEIGRIKPDVIAMGCGTTWVHCVNDAAKRIKQRFPHIRIVGGGMHFNALPKESLSENQDIDIIVVGEGEVTLLELLRELQKPDPNLKPINGLCYRVNGKPVLTEPRCLIPDLDALPLPAYHLFPMDKYVHYSYWPHAVRVVTSRGCAGRCYFCAQWQQYDKRREENVGVWRGLSGKRIADQAEVLVKKHGVKMFDIQDDEFNNQQERIEEFCDEIIKRKLDFRWMFLGRADSFIEQMHIFPKMRKAGCIMTLVGIEAETDEKLKEMGKDITLEQVKQAIDELRRNDISTCGTVMAGFPDDDERTIKKRAQILDELDPDLMTINLLVPYPGTELWDQMKDDPKLEVKDFKFYDMAHALMPTKHLSRDDLNRLASWVYREFYSNQARVHRMLNGYTDPWVGACCRNYLEVASRVEDSFVKNEPFI